MRKSKKSNPRKFSELENQLRSSLKPVAPRPDYVQNLLERLTDTPHLQVTFNRNRPLQYILFGLAGAVSIILILITTLRMLLSLLGILGLLRYARRHKPKEKLAPKSLNSIV